MNEITNQQPRRLRFRDEIKAPKFQALINQTLSDPKKVERYTAAIVSAVTTNASLQQCTAVSILSGSLLAESLNLAHSPQLGQYYLVPFKVKAKYDKETNELISPEHFDATFVLGYKGYLQLAIRSGYYKKINVMEIKKGELISYNPFEEDIVLKPIQDVDEREAAPTVGYYAMFEYTNGFRKVIYWSKKQMIAHADKYSPAFSASATRGRNQKVSFEDYEAGRYDKRDEWLYSSFWYKDFDGMAKKTMLRQLISKWGVMSTDMAQAIENDDRAVTISDGQFVAPPEEPEPIDITQQQDIPPEDANAEEEISEVNFDEV